MESWCLESQQYLWSLYHSINCYWQWNLYLFDVACCLFALDEPRGMTKWWNSWGYFDKMIAVFHWKASYLIFKECIVYLLHGWLFFTSNFTICIILYVLETSMKTAVFLCLELYPCMLYNVDGSMFFSRQTSIRNGKEIGIGKLTQLFQVFWWSRSW